MSIAFQALVILAIALPGIIYHRTVTDAPELREKRSISDELAQSLIAAIILHALWLLIFNGLGRICFPPVHVNLDAALMLSMGQFGKDSFSLPEAIGSVTRYPLSVTTYFLSLYLSSAVAGEQVRKFLGNQKNAKSFLGRFAFWLHSQDEGPARQFGKWSRTFEYDRETEIPFFSAVVELGKEAHLIFGQLREFIPDDDGYPARYILSDVHRRLLTDEDSFYEGTIRLWRKFPTKTRHF